jgi:hypothetical protein
MSYRHGATVYEITVRRDAGHGMIELDGEMVTGGFIQLDDNGGIHRVMVSIPASIPTAKPSASPAVAVGNLQHSLAAD